MQKTQQAEARRSRLQDHKYCCTEQALLTAHQLLASPRAIYQNFPLFIVVASQELPVWQITGWLAMYWSICNISIENLVTGWQL